MKCVKCDKAFNNHDLLRGYYDPELCYRCHVRFEKWLKRKRGCYHE